MVRFFRRKKKDEDDAPEEPGIEPDVAAASEDADKEAEADAPPPVDEAVERTRKTWFSRIGGIFKKGLSEELWEELEETLIAADTGVQTTLRILEEVRGRVDEGGIKDSAAALDILKDDLVDILEAPADSGRLWRNGDSGDSIPRPAVLLVVGVNGTGKTTSIAKLAHAYQSQGKKVILAAGDTFRAAAIEQLKQWGERIGTDVVAHKEGADPGAVVFDALVAAEKRGADVLIIDTAGRLHTKANLMQELSKIHRIIQRKVPDAPHEVLLVLDATTGQNAIHQAKYFTEAVGVTGVVLAKLDGTAKGGVIFSVCDQMNLPVRFVGTGERPQDLAPFKPREFVEALFSE
ncbi:MAG: signal recognition particle-docking protein FtsY [Chloroflexi bacterium]|nr:signal recognition particle-docking protein FtsY [Chloroflexota bacterium]